MFVCITHWWNFRQFLVNADARTHLHVRTHMTNAFTFGMRTINTSVGLTKGSYTQFALYLLILRTVSQHAHDKYEVKIKKQTKLSDKLFRYFVQTVIGLECQWVNNIQFFFNESEERVCEGDARERESECGRSTDRIIVFHYVELSVRESFRMRAAPPFRRTTPKNYGVLVRLAGRLYVSQTLYISARARSYTRTLIYRPTGCVWNSESNDKWRYTYSIFIHLFSCVLSHLHYATDNVIIALNSDKNAFVVVVQVRSVSQCLFATHSLAHTPLHSGTMWLLLPLPSFLFVVDLSFCLSSSTLRVYLA